MVKLVIFDLDGTLVNSLQDLGTAINVSLEKMGLPTHNMEKFNYFVGNGIKKLCERSLSDENSHRVDELYNLFSNYYGSHYAIYTKPYPHIEELLNSLKENNIKIAVASNKAENFAIQIVCELFPKIKFDCIKGQVETREKKPSPDIALEIMKDLEVSKEDTIMVGDTNVDIQTAKNSGIKSIGCLWGFRDYEELYKADADHIILNPLEVLDIIKE
ncbi:MAG: HAD family hydrolase [Oscillospiraceae bacterium]